MFFHEIYHIYWQLLDTSLSVLLTVTWYFSVRVADQDQVVSGTILAESGIFSLSHLYCIHGSFFRTLFLFFNLVVKPKITCFSVQYMEIRICFLRGQIRSKIRNTALLVLSCYACIVTYYINKTVSYFTSFPCFCGI